MADKDGGSVCVVRNPQNTEEYTLLLDFIPVRLLYQPVSVVLPSG